MENINFTLTMTTYQHINLIMKMNVKVQFCLKKNDINRGIRGKKYKANDLKNVVSSKKFMI